MQDMQAQMEKLLVAAEDCALISKLATVAKHRGVLAAEVERSIAESAGRAKD